ncbi:MAG: signal peptide peptidase SppA [Muribaculaceae bacterium]|nr:signal peptide peptidase SppA [Muribaculaceae bacterium]MDE6330454.1 signal peptide peptidase SppA [Muribaculaceae bacterium]
MLKKFFLNFLSSFIGAWVALGLFVAALVIVGISLVAKLGISESSNAGISRHSVMTIDLTGIIEERETPTDIDYMELIRGDISSPMTLTSLTTAIREAADNKDIDMIYLKCGGVSAAPATLRALRNELSEFRKSGKKIYAYADAYAQGDYYVATVADSMFVNPVGTVAVNGISGGVLYYKDLLDKIGVQMQIVKVGTFKSAVEPYISNEMSAPARAQLDTLYGNMWNLMVQEICSSRPLKPAGLNKMIDSDFLQLQDGVFAEQHKLVDKAVYERTMDGRIAAAVGVDEEKLNYVSHSAVAAQSNPLAALSKGKHIAVLYATGEIMEGSKTGINCEALVPVITELADNDDVAGMVLRVNSPGGSVFGSEQIAEALGYFQSKGKPLAVSMGDYAASGGYWISCHADRIFADPLTITGSIGIFGMIPNVAELARKVGVTPQYVATNPEADFPSLLRPLTDTQLAAMQKMIEVGYDKFLTRVATGRKMDKARVAQIAEGRVYDGQMALTLGLVDALGSLSDATEWVKSKLPEKERSKCGIVDYPSVEPGFWDMVRLSTSSELSISLIKEAASYAPEAESAVEMANVLRRRPVQARIVPIQFYATPRK